MISPCSKQNNDRINPDKLLNSSNQIAIDRPPDKIEKAIKTFRTDLWFLQKGGKSRSLIINCRWSCMIYLSTEDTTQTSSGKSVRHVVSKIRTSQRGSWNQWRGETAWGIAERRYGNWKAWGLDTSSVLQRNKFIRICVTSLDGECRCRGKLLLLSQTPPPSVVGKWQKLKTSSYRD